ncbi:MAG: transposase, partial [Saprospiraceae bacterium]|nr:transposase [Saprospiraceae bacterium]
MEKMYKAYFIKRTIEMLGDGELAVEGMNVGSAIEAVRYKKWNVYAKAPFAGPSQIIEYLGRYTHKIAISNHRILAIDEHTVKISCKDYRAAGQKKTLTLTHDEFIRRFALHIMPKRFVRIRHFGFLSSTWKRTKLNDLQSKLTGIAVAPLPIVIKRSHHKCCPSFKNG